MTEPPTIRKILWVGFRWTLFIALLFLAVHFAQAHMG